jgi:hypothetical protein
MRSPELISWSIIGILLTLVGLVAFASPQISYTSRETLPNTHVSVRRPTFVVPRAVALLIMAGGVATILVGGRPRRE